MAAEKILERMAEATFSKHDLPEDIQVNLPLLSEIILDRDEDSQVRIALLRAISLGGHATKPSPKVTGSLSRVLVDETENPNVRSWIAMTLLEFGAPEEVGPALVAAASSPNTEVRVNASQQLGRLQLSPRAELEWASLRCGRNG